MIRIAMLVLVLVAGCKSKDQAEEKAGNDKVAQPADKPAADKPTADKPAEAAKPGGAWAKRPTADCPAYPGRAAVAIADVDGGYTATITTADTGAVKDIHAHARYVEGAAAANAGADALQFGGATGDRTRNCPIVLDGTTIAVEERPDGAVLTVKARDAAGTDALRATAREKAELLGIMRDATK